MLLKKIKGLFIKKKKTVIVKNEYDQEYRCKVHNGNEIWLDWYGHPFPLRMIDDGSLAIAMEGLQGTGKVYKGFSWRPDDHLTICPNSTF